MKYCVLLMGGNRMVTDKFFAHIWNEFECITTSNLYEDIVNHLKYFTPDVMIYFLRNESTENIDRVLQVKDRLQRANIPLVLIGEKEECDSFEEYTADMAQLVLDKTLSVKEMSIQLGDFLDSKKKQDEMLRRQEEQRKQEEQRRQEEEQREEELRRQQEEQQRKKHVLVVDDDPLMLKMIKEHLYPEYDVATAINGKVALKFLENRVTDLILLDYEMPQENGPAVLEKLRAGETTGEIPVIFLTGINDKEKIQKALSLKPQGYLLKPIERDKLLETIRGLLG